MSQGGGPTVAEVLQGLRQPDVTRVELDKGERDVILLALAKLSMTRPGWHPACLVPLATKLGGLQVYEQFRRFGPDPSPTAPSIECPRCHRVSFNTNDVEQRYCGACHAFHRDMVNEGEPSGGTPPVRNLLSEGEGGAV